MDLTDYIDPVELRIAMMPDTGGHTALDYAVLTELGIDVHAVQARERGVPCMVCREQTFNHAGGCDRPGHYRPPGAARKEIARRNADLS